MNHLRRLFAAAQFTRRDVAWYAVFAVALIAGAVAEVTGQRWLYAVTWTIVVGSLAYSAYYAVRIVAMLIRHRRERAAAKAAAWARRMEHRGGGR